MRWTYLLLLTVGLCLGACHRAARHEEQAVLEPLLERYFSTWSAKDMAAYGACFHPSARITYVDKGGASVTHGLTDFLHGQKLSHAQSPVPMTEVPTGMEISGDSRVAQAKVRWKLTKGAETITGTDYFTLLKTPEGWRIIALVFYND